MSLKKKILLSAVMLSGVTFAHADITENAVQQQAVLSNINDTKDIKNFVIEAVQSLLPYDTQVTVGDVKIDNDGNFIALNVLVMSKEDSGMNIAINKIAVEGLDVDGVVNGDFSLDFSGVSITNLGAIVAESDDKNSTEQQKAVIGAADNSDPVGIVANSLGESIYNFNLKYDYQKQQLALDINSTNTGSKFIFAKVNVDSVNLYNAKVSQLGTKLMEAIGDGYLGNVDLSTDFSSVIKQSTKQMLGKQKDYPTFVANLSFDKQSGDLKLYANGKLADKDFFKYNSYVKNVNLSNIAIKNLVDDYVDALGSAYINNADSMLDVDFKFEKTDFGVKSPMLSVFDALGTDVIDIKIKTKHDYEDNNYHSAANISATSLASLNLKSEGVVDGKFALLPYMGVDTDTKEKDIYDCQDKLCLKSIDINFTNDNLLQQAATMINPDPNTTSQQVLGSYGALMQLMAVQQKDPFVRGVLSSFAMFLQNPRNVEIKATANKPVNQNVLALMIFHDINKLEESNRIKSNGNIQVSGKQPQLDFFGNIDKIFDMKFYVNGSQVRMR